MSGTDAIRVILICGEVLSLAVSVFAVGVAWGSVKRDIKTIKAELGEIKRMFVLRPRNWRRD
jgi:hypothetical protein